jgi:uncharacterized protein YqgV (UPF0045/DUF77 family)
MPQVRVEFTVEPFNEGQPGAHVLAAWDAVESHGYQLATGPFSSEVEIASAYADEVIASLVRAALSNGAERVSLQIERVPSDQRLSAMAPAADRADS